MSGSLAHYLVVFFLGATKFQIASVYGKAAGLSFSAVFFVNVAGGCAGVLFFLFLTDYLIRLFSRWKGANGAQVSENSEKDKPFKKKIFTPWKRFLIRFMKRFGMAGIAFVTPSVLSIPLGVFLADRLNGKFIHNRRVLVLHMMISVFFWSLVFNLMLHV